LAAQPGRRADEGEHVVGGRVRTDGAGGPGSFDQCLTGRGHSFAGRVEFGGLVVEAAEELVQQQFAVIDAARAAEVSRVVKVSAWRPHPDAKLSVRAHWEIEQHLKGSCLTWSILQPTGYMQNFFTGEGGFARSGALAGPYGEGRVAYIDAYDIAACAAVLLTGSRGAGMTYALTGPEALTHEEIATKLTVPFRDLPPEEAARDLRARGLPGWFVDDLLWLYADLASGGLSEVTTAVSDLTGRAPRTFDEFLAANESVTSMR
jgi:uncharacterized protein YbjT (DUF2867 family)